MKSCLTLSLLINLALAQIRFGDSTSSASSSSGGRPSFSSRPSRPSFPSFPSSPSRPSRPSFPSSPSRPSRPNRPVQSVEFENNNNNNNGVSGVKSLADVLGKDTTEVKSLIRRVNTNSRKRGESCRTPLGEAGTCQYIFSSQCSSILQIILQ